MKKILENKLQNCYVDNNKMFDALINKYFDGYCYSGSLFFSLIFDKNPRLLRGDLSLGTYGFNHGWVELKYMFLIQHLLDYMKKIYITK